MSLSAEEIRQAITTGISEAIDTKTKEFYVNREQHYKHHQFIEEFIELMKTSRRTATRVVIVAMVSGVLGLIVMGFWHKIQELIK